VKKSRGILMARPELALKRRAMKTVMRIRFWGKNLWFKIVLPVGSELGGGDESEGEAEERDELSHVEEPEGVLDEHRDECSNQSQYTTYVLYAIST
jgi:hypothetical protein